MNSCLTHRNLLRLVAVLVTIANFAMIGGCSLFKNRWPAPEFATIRPLASLFKAEPSSNLAAAESAYQTALDLEQSGQPRCVDYFYVAATNCWPEIESSGSTECVNPRTLEIYHSALRKLLTTGHRFNRLDPRSGMRIELAEGTNFMPIRHRGFAWDPNDFDYIEPIGKYCFTDLNNIYRCRGLGISTLVTHCRKPNEPYRNQAQKFPCTVLLRPDQSLGCACGFSLELADPFRVENTMIGGKPYAITRDKSAFFAYALAHDDRNYVNKFFRPGLSEDSDGLIMLEPFQAEKIPLIFVHGLLSSPLTWATLANEIAACPQLMDRYQIWAFEYATGEPFLGSAAVLRRQLNEVQARYDPHGQNRNLHNAVLIGHSMGGLISKLMITESGDCLWKSVSRCPIESIYTSDETRSRLIQSFYFQPLSLVKRVVYIGAPHKGAPGASGPIGRFGAFRVKPPQAIQEMHRQLIADNQGVFSSEFSKRLPTSIDLMRPDSQLLQAVDRLMVSPKVAEHSIVGVGYPSLGALNSDGVVPARSARRQGVETHLEVWDRHMPLHRNKKSIDEVMAILQRHLWE